MIEVSRTMDNTMDFDPLSTDDIEHKVGLNNQNSIAVFSKFRMAWDTAQERMSLKQANPFIELLDK